MQNKEIQNYIKIISMDPAKRKKMWIICNLNHQQENKNDESIFCKSIFFFYTNSVIKISLYLSLSFRGSISLNSSKDELDPSLISSGKRNTKNNLISTVFFWKMQYLSQIGQRESIMKCEGLKYYFLKVGKNPRLAKNITLTLRRFCGFLRT